MSDYQHGGNIFSVARSLGIAAKQLIDFSASINPLGLPPSVKVALLSAIDSLIHYPDTSCGELKQALADEHGVASTQLCMANGSTEIIYQVPLLLPGHHALIVAPAFSEYALSLQQHGWEIRHLILSPQDDFRLDLDELAEMLAQGSDVLYLCNPGNPSGKLYAPEIVSEVYRLCRATGTFLVLDEAFMDFCEESSAKRLIMAEEGGIVLRSMTKFYGMPGLRLGYALAHSEVIRRLEGHGGPWNVNTLAQVAGMAALADREYRRESIVYITKERVRLAGELAAIRGLTVYPSSANFLLIRIDGPLDAEQLRRQLLDRRILIRSCANFAGLSDRFFRVAVRTAAENDRLLACLKGIFG